MTNSHRSPDHRDGAPDWEALARSFAGESDAAESAAVSAWLAVHPEDARAWEVLESAARRSAPPPAVDVEAALQRVHERMRAPQAPVIPLPAAPRSTRPMLLPWIAAAAAVALMVVGALRSHPTPAEAVTYATVTGATQAVRLADGTDVVLGPASELVLDPQFRDGRREVRLRGTAAFAVTHNASHPFAVRAGKAIITDIGTKFTVRHDGDDDVDVSVTEGSVRFAHADGGSAVLAAGDAASLQAGGTVAIHRAGASEDDAAWTHGKLVFREAPLQRVRADLRRWFGMELVVADSSLAARHLTASFARDSREQVLDVIALALGATYDVKGDTVTLRPASVTVRPRK